MSVSCSSLFCHDLPKSSSGVEIMRGPWGSAPPPTNKVLASFLGQLRVCSQLVLIVRILQQRGILSQSACKYARIKITWTYATIHNKVKANMTCKYDDAAWPALADKMCAASCMRTTITVKSRKSAKLRCRTSPVQHTVADVAHMSNKSTKPFAQTWRGFSNEHGSHEGTLVATKAAAAANCADAHANADMLATCMCGCDMVITMHRKCSSGGHLDIDATSTPSCTHARRQAC